MGYSKSDNSNKSSSNSYTKSYNNTTKQTYAQRHSPTKHNGQWYDAGGGKVRNTDSYFNTIKENGKRWTSNFTEIRTGNSLKTVSTKTRTFDSDGFDQDGFDREGYNELGYDSEGYNRNGAYDAQSGHQTRRVSGHL